MKAIYTRPGYMNYYELEIRVSLWKSWRPWINIDKLEARKSIQTNLMPTNPYRCVGGQGVHKVELMARETI